MKLYSTSLTQLIDSQQIKEKSGEIFSLREEMEKCWHARATTIPVIIGAMVAITPVHQMWLCQMPATQMPTQVSCRKVCY